MTRELTRFHFRDPFEVVARMEEQEIRRQERSPEARAQRAREGLEELFGEGNMRDQDYRLRISSELLSRLENWGWVMRGPRGSRGMSQTGKVCHMLAVQAGAYKFDDLAVAPSDDQARDAHAIQRAWDSLLMPAKHKKMLSLNFIHQTDPRAICRALAIRFREFNQEMASACHMIENIEKRLEARTRIADNIRTT